MIRKAAKSNVMFNKIIFNLTIQQADFFFPYLVPCHMWLRFKNDPILSLSGLMAFCETVIKKSLKKKYFVVFVGMNYYAFSCL